MDVEKKLYIGVVEENIDPRKEGRVKIRVQTLYHQIKTEDIPWAAPFLTLGGKAYEVPAIGKLVNVLYFQNDIYDPYYIFSENYNINLKNKLSSLSDEEYVDFNSLLFDERTQIFGDSEEFTIDHLFNKVTLNNSSINLELKDNTQKLNLGSKNSSQEAVLGTRFFTWMDKFMKELAKPSSLIGNSGSPILKPRINELIIEYNSLRKDFVSKNVKIVDNDAVSKLSREANNQKNDADLIIEDTDENDKLLQERIQRQNDAACQKIKGSKSTSFIPTDTIMELPLTGNRISSRFGMRVDPTNASKMQGHGGIDIAAGRGTPIKSPYAGVVIFSDFDSTYGGGNSIRIKHSNGFITGYCHMSIRLKKVGAEVETGDIIGLVGNTGGHTTGPHLHFTVTTPAGEKVDPELYFAWTPRDNDAPKNSNSTAGSYKGQNYATKSSPCSDNSMDSQKDNLDESPLAIAPNDTVPVLKGSFYDKVLTFLIPFEGFISKSKYDVNAYRVGYGSDTITRDGKVYRVTASGPYSTTTEAEAKIDLVRRIKEFEKTLIDQIGGKSVYNKIPDNAKIAFLDNIYNYGSLIGRDREDRMTLVTEVTRAVKNNKWKEVGDLLIKLTYNHNAGKSYQETLRKRRRAEGVLISKGGNAAHFV